MTEQQAPVLVVEDDQALREMLTVILTTSGYQVETASNRQEGLAWLSQQRPRLIILDLRMNDEDGESFAQAVRARFGSAVPIIVLSGAANASERAAAIGAEGLLTKPFQYDELIELVQRLLSATG